MGFLFPRLPLLIADPTDDKDDSSSDALSEVGDTGRSSVGAHPKMTCGQFVLVTFFIVAGGPTGIETVVSSGGPLYACIGLLIIPWLWSVPLPHQPSSMPPSLTPLRNHAGACQSRSCLRSSHAPSRSMAAPFDTSSDASAGVAHDLQKPISNLPQTQQHPGAPITRDAPAAGSWPASLACGR